MPQKSPFKFLDSYTREDKDIFFGREKETEELYQKVFDSKLLLLYGVSGTGKTSLINCGLANKFEESDWLPITVRRGNNILDNLKKQLSNHLLNKKEQDLLKTIRSVYLDHFKPIYLIFDQFEELFILGTQTERDEIISSINSILESDLQCRIIISMREEYIACLGEFEEAIPYIFDNRYRIEQMTRKNALSVINGPCQINSIHTEDGFAETLLENLSPDSNKIELTYLQVYLDRIYKVATDQRISDTENLIFQISMLEKTGDVTDLLGNFLEEQIRILDDPDTSLVILKSFVSVKGTKKQLNIEEATESTRSLGKNISTDLIDSQIRKLVDLRILRDKDDNGRYELIHDSLATKIYEKITAIEKDIIELIGFLEQAYSDFVKRQKYLSLDDLTYISPYLDKIYLKSDIIEFIKKSKREAEKTQRRRKRMIIYISTAIIIILTSLLIWAFKERGTAIKMRATALQKMEESDILFSEAQKAKQEALIQKKLAVQNEELALNAKELAEKELYESIINTWTVSAERMNVLYAGIDNPVSIVVSGIPGRDLIAVVSNGSIRMTGNEFVIKPVSIGECIVAVLARTRKGELIDLGNRSFRVKNIPLPVVSFKGKDDFVFTKEELLGIDTVQCSISSDFEIGSKSLYINYFELWTTVDGHDIHVNSTSNLFTQRMKDLINRCSHGSEILITNIRVSNSWGDDINIRPVTLIISESETISYYDSIYTKLSGILESNSVESSKNGLIQLRKEILEEQNKSFIKDLVDTLETKYSHCDIELKIPIAEEMEFYMNRANEMSVEFDTASLISIQSEILKNKSIEYIVEKKYIEGIELAIEASEAAAQFVNRNQTFSVYSFAYFSQFMTDTQKDQLIDIYELDDYDLKYALPPIIDSIVIQHQGILSEYINVSRTHSPSNYEILLYNIYTAEELKEKISEMDMSIREDLASNFSTLSFWLLQKEFFRRAFKAAEIARFSDHTFKGTYTNLALVYLLNNQYESAVEVYTKWKNEPYNSEFPTFKEVFLQDFADLEAGGITHPDFEKIRELLNR